MLDNTGLEETDQYSGTPDDIKSPRGLRGYTLIGGTDLAWRVQGNLGGNVNYPDRYRGIYNVGGLYGERKGWYLPGSPEDDFTSGGPGDSPAQKPGVIWYKGDVEVIYPVGVDIHYRWVVY